MDEVDVRFNVGSEMWQKPHQPTAFGCEREETQLYGSVSARFTVLIYSLLAG
jgi:hypothetical protein